MCRLRKRRAGLLTLNVNKNAFAEINYGTGSDVATEDVNDARTPMKVDWLTSSYVRLRLRDPRLQAAAMSGRVEGERRIGR